MPEPDIEAARIRESLRGAQDPLPETMRGLVDGATTIIESAEGVTTFGGFDEERSARLRLQVEDLARQMDAGEIEFRQETGE